METISTPHGTFLGAWDRWLDGPDFNLDQHTPEENPGACVVTALDEGTADWIIMTNGRQWRLYSSTPSLAACSGPPASSTTPATRYRPTTAP